MAMDRPRCAHDRLRRETDLTRAAIWLVALVAVTAPAWPSSARADNTFVVNSALDNGSPGTLRWAIDQANAAGAGTQSITFSLPSGATITLSSSLPALNNGSGSIVVDGSGANNLTISGNNTSRVFFVYAGNVTISNLNVANGLAKGGNGGNNPLNGGDGGLGAGGALFVNQGANVTVQDVTFNGNSAVGGTGGTLSGGGVAGGAGGGGLGGNGGNGDSQGGSQGGGGGLIGNGTHGLALSRRIF